MQLGVWPATEPELAGFALIFFHESQEKEAAEKQLQSVLADRSSVDHTIEDLRTRNAQLAEEVEALKAERTQVRSRIEKLLGQMDLL